MMLIPNSVIHTLSIIILLVSCSDKTEFIENIDSKNTITNNIETTDSNKVITHQSAKNKIQLGSDVLESKNFEILHGKNVGLVTNRTGLNSNLISTIDLLHNSDKVNLVALFGPEHGIRGNYEGGDVIESYIDSLTGLPVYSLYGKNRRPSKEMLKDIDVIVYDIQDIGIRSYTYISTMGNLIEAASKNNIEFIVLDRPNPIGGEKIEGNIVEDNFRSFIGQFPIPYVYGLTCGELAKLLVGENYIKTDPDFKLTVVPMQNWSRDMIWKDTGLQWIPTSPHIPNQYSPYFCAMTGILGELRSAVSVGVGYTLPFQIVGTEWINSNLLSDELNNYNISGLEFSPISFKPYYAFGKGKTLNGIQIFIKDYKTVNLLHTQFYIIWALKKLYPEKNIFDLAPKNEVKMFNKGIGSDFIYKKYQENENLDIIFQFLAKDLAEFKGIAEKYYLYK